MVRKEPKSLLIPLPNEVNLLTQCLLLKTRGAIIQDKQQLQLNKIHQTGRKEVTNQELLSNCILDRQMKNQQ